MRIMLLALLCSIDTSKTNCTHAIDTKYLSKGCVSRNITLYSIADKYLRRNGSIGVLYVRYVELVFVVIIIVFIRYR